MSRYIDADKVTIKYRGGFHDDHVVDYDSFMHAPSIDIVRCKECEHWLDNSGLCKHWSKLYGSVLTKDVDFCSRGERRE